MVGNRNFLVLLCEVEGGRLGSLDLRERERERERESRIVSGF